MWGKADLPVGGDLYTSFVSNELAGDERVGWRLTHRHRACVPCLRTCLRTCARESLSLPPGRLNAYAWKLAGGQARAISRFCGPAALWSCGPAVLSWGVKWGCPIHTAQRSIQHANMPTARARTLSPYRILITTDRPALADSWQAVRSAAASLPRCLGRCAVLACRCWCTSGEPHLK